MNKLNDPNISLNYKTHVYSLVDDPDFNFTSSTGFIHKFFEKFNKYKVAAKLLKMPKYKGRTREDLFNEWKEASNRGTNIHSELEHFVLKGTLPETIPGKFGVQWLESSVPKNCALLSEIIIYSKELKIAGMVDLLIFDPEDNSYTLVDWKTNKKINITSYKGKTGILSATENVEDCNFNHYSLQLSLYRYILENYYDLTIKNQYLIHLTDSGINSMVCPYMEETLQKMLE